MTERTKYWTNPSVLALAGDSEPIEFMTKKAREVVLGAIQEGWRGPPFDPFELAEYLKIPTVPREDLHDARTVPVGSQSLRIEFNPNRPRGRMRFSVAHEVAHTLFPDCVVTIRNRAQSGKRSEDDWQLELLCNIAAAEFLMPVGSGIGLEHESVTIDNLLRLQKQYDVSTEALSLRLVKITEEPCSLFAAARTADDEEVAIYRVDYSVDSRSFKFNVPRGLKIRGKTVLSECTAVGFTAKGSERWVPSLPKIDVECVGIPPYPGHYFPRIIGIARSKSAEQPMPVQIKYLWGDAAEPRGAGRRIIAHIVNDKTPNWGAGFALYLRKKMPFVQDEFREWVSVGRENLALGKIHQLMVSDDLSVVHMIAQHGYGPSRKPRIRYGVLQSCLDKLAEIASTQGASVHMPRIGSGQAGGNWGIIRELIDEALVRRGVEGTVYNLPTSEPMKETQELLDLGIGGR